MKVGDTETLDIGNISHLQGCQWTISRPENVIFTTTPQSYTTRVTIKAIKAFSGSPCVVHCKYYYLELDPITGRYIYSRTGYKDWEVSVSEKETGGDSGESNNNTVFLSQSEANIQIDESIFISASGNYSDKLKWTLSCGGDIAYFTSTQNNRVCVHGIKSGTTYLTATTTNGAKASCKINVLDYPVFADGDIFTVKTKEGIDLEIKVTNAKEGICQIGNDIERGKNRKNTAIDKSYNGSLTIPEKAKGLTVTAISAGAFHNCKITSLYMPNTITHIYNYAFYECSFLEKIEISENLKYLGGFSEDYSFGNYARSQVFSKTKWEDNQPNGLIYAGPVAYWYKGKDLLSENSHITIKEGTLSIAEGCFIGCKQIVSFSFPKTLQSIGAGAFSETEWLKMQPSGILYIGNIAYAYIGKEQMPQNYELTIQEGTTGITGYAFYDCPNLKSIELPSSVNNIGRSAFGKCPNIEIISVAEDNPIYDSRYKCNAVLETNTNRLVVGCKNSTIPNNCKIIGKDAFLGCENLKSVAWVSEVETIDNYAFYGCSSLQNLIFPDKLKNVAADAFQGCKNINSLYIGASLQNLSYSHFSSMTKLNSIVVSENNKMYDSRNRCNAIIDKTNDELILGCGNTLIPSTIKSIGHSAFRGNENILSIEIPNTVKVIDYAAFDECYNLTDVKIGSGVQEIHSNPFKGCGSLKSIIVDSQNSIYDSRENCNAIILKETSKLQVGCMNTIIPNTILSIEYGAFEGSSISSIIIPNSVKTIGFSAFYKCEKLENVTLGENISEILEYAFWNCPSIKNIHSKIKMPPPLPEYAFWNSSYTKALLYVPQESLGKYISTDSWNRFINIQEYNPTGIQEVKDETKSNKIYSIHGYPLKKEQKGINIINGKKIFIK